MTVKFLVDTDDLKAALQPIKTIAANVNKSLTNLIDKALLRVAHVESLDLRVELWATNFQIGLLRTIDGNGFIAPDTFSAVIDVPRLADFVRKLDKGSIVSVELIPGAPIATKTSVHDIKTHEPIELTEITDKYQPDSLQFACGKRRLTLTLSVAVADYPPIPTFPEPDSLPVAIESDVLHDAIGRVVVAAAKEDNRPILKALNIDIQERRNYYDGNGELCQPGAVYMTCVDGYRLHTMSINAYVQKSANLLMDASDAKFFAGLLPYKGADINLVHIGLNDAGKLVVMFDDHRLIVEPIDGKFPDYGQILAPAQEGEWGFDVDREALLDALDSAEPYAKSSAANRVLMQAAPQTTGNIMETTLTVSASEVGAGSAETDVEAVNTNLPLLSPWRAAINLKLLRDALKAIDTQAVQIRAIPIVDLKTKPFAARDGVQVGDVHSPILVTPVGENHFQALIMPMSKAA